MKSVLIVVSAFFTLVNAQCRLRGICYALDNSGSISSREYQQVKTFTLASARSFADPNFLTRYSATWFTSGSGTIQAPTTNLEGEFVPTIQGDRKRSGGTNIYLGLSSCLNLLGDVGPRAIVVVTDGQGASGPNPVPAIRASNVALVSVGVGNGIDVEFLRNIATRPEFYIPATFDMLPTLASTIEEAACRAIDVIEPSPSPEPEMTPTPMPPTTDDCETAFNNCDFTFNGATTVQSFDISGPADTPFTPRITKKTGPGVIGTVNSQAGTFEPVFADAGRISLEGMQPFAPTAFKALTRMDGGSGIAHETFQGDQLVVAANRCVVVYFQSWQILSANNTVLGNVNLPSRGDSACVAFNTFA